MTDQEGRQVAGVGVTQSAGGAVVDGDEEGGEAVVAGVAHEMVVQAGDQFGGAEMLGAGSENLAAQRGLQAGHEQGGGNSLSGDVRNRNGDVRGTELNEIVVIAADGARGFADGFDFDTGNVRDLLRKKLILDFAGDGELALEALALLLFFDEVGDGPRHFIERIAEDAELIAMLDVDTMGEVSGADELRGVIEVGNGGGDERGDFDQQKKYAESEEEQKIGIAQFAEGGEDAGVQAGRTGVEDGQDRPGGFDAAVVAEIGGVKPGDDFDRGVQPKHGALQTASTRHDGLGEHVLAAS